ncbi:MAG: methionine synthase [Xenococcaceae cyanobacterium MO_167.B52]|nr:methionine synthase [Xenococcaceae cyanobacterium MO_167.B52]
MNQKRGIYITANDKVIDHAIALMNSIRIYDQETPVVLIPYDENYHLVANTLEESHGVKIYQDLEFIDQLSQKLYDIFGENFFDKPNKLRKQACWFGEFEEFLYIDTDIVVFDKIIDFLNYFTHYDFICYDYQHKSGLKNIFTPKILEAAVIQETDLKDTFNSGLWGAKKNIITEAELTKIFTECAANPEYFDFSQKVSDQPIFNYMVLTRIKKRFNIVNRAEKAPGSWAGSKHFQQQDYKLFDPKTEQPIQYLHWAGIKIEPGCPYWDIWKHYRYLGESHPPDDNSLAPKEQQNTWRKIFTKGWKKLKPVK